MTDPVTMSFSLNEKAINTAIAAELPRLLKDLQFNYTSGRAPKGLTADVTLTEAMIRQAVTSYARRTVNASFTHLSIVFQATRGEEGQTANITASTAPIEAEAEVEAPAAVTTAPANAPTEVEAVEVDSSATVEAEASNEVVPAEEAEQAEAPAAASRSKLFGNLTRPDNSAAE